MQPFEPAAKALSADWDIPLDPDRVRLWSRNLGQSVVAVRDAEVLDYQRGQRPPCPPNAVALMVIGMDGGTYQGLEKSIGKEIGGDVEKKTEQDTGNSIAKSNANDIAQDAEKCVVKDNANDNANDNDTNDNANDSQPSRWRGNKVLTVSSYLPGDGKAPEHGGRRPRKLVTTLLATAQGAKQFGPMARVEAERRGLRQAAVVIALGDGGNWIDPLLETHFRVDARIIDWWHATEHLWDCAKAIHGPGTPAAAHTAEYLEALLWDGKVDRVIEHLSAQSQQLGPPLKSDTASNPRRILANNVGYFTKHQNQMQYPDYRSRGWPIGSGDTEAGVKQFNKRIKGTEQFWSTEGVEAVMALRGLWLSQDDRWDSYWANRRAYVN